MRAVLIITLLFAIALPCFAELTQQDLEKIGNLIDRRLEPIKLDIAEMKGKMATKDDLLNMRKDMTGKLESIKLDVAEMKGKMATKDDILNMWKDMTGKMDVLYGVTIGVLIAIIVAILSVTLPPVLFATLSGYFVNRQRWLERRKQTRDEGRSQKIEAELEELKTIREVAKRLAEEKPELVEAYRMVGLL